MERIRYFFVLLVVISIASLAAARSGASEAAAGGLMNVADFFAPIEARNQNLRRLRAAPTRRRVLLDGMPWDTVTDQPGSVATTVRKIERERER
jgi:hypothetical protein